MASSKRKPTRKAKAGTSRASREARIPLWIEAMIENGGNQTQAAVAAGYTPGAAAERAGCRLYKDVRVRAMLEERRKQALAVAEEETGLSVSRTLKELGRIAYFDPRRMFDSHGNLKKVSDLDEDTAAALASFEIFDEFAGKGERRELIGQTKKVKVFDKNSAIEKAMRHLGLFEVDNRQQQQRTVNIGALTVSLDFDKMRAGRVLTP